MQNAFDLLCGRHDSFEPAPLRATEITEFAPASLTDSLKEIATFGLVERE